MPDSRTQDDQLKRQGAVPVSPAVTSLPEGEEGIAEGEADPQGGAATAAHEDEAEISKD